MKASLLTTIWIVGLLSLPARAQDAATITELSQVLEALPKEVVVALHTSKKEAAVMQGTDALRDKVLNKQATFKFKVDKIEKDLPGPDKRERYRIKAEDTRLNKGSTQFVAYLVAHFLPEESSKVVAVKKGAQITATGRIATPSISVGTPLRLQLVLAEAKLE
jgi:hypothetical protein